MISIALRHWTRTERSFALTHCGNWASPFIDESRSEWVTGGGPGEMEQSDCPRFLPHPDYIDVLDRLDALDLIIKYPQLGFSQLQNCIMHLRILIANLDLRGQ